MLEAGVVFHDEFAQRIAESIGDGVSPAEVEAFLKLSKERQYLFHGIKSAKLAQKVRLEGVKPMTTEAGGASMWTTGERVFGRRDVKSWSWMLDSSFFYWSGVRDADPGRSVLSIAVTDGENLSKVSDLSFKPDSEICIPQIVRPENMAFFQVDVPSGQLCAMEELFHLLDSKLQNGLPGGESFSLIRP